MLLKQSVYACVCVTAEETCMSIPSKATWPHIAAMWSGVRPRTSWVLTVALWWMRQSAHSSWPYAAFTTQHSCIQCPLRIHFDAYSLCAPCAGSGVERIDSHRFLAGVRTRRLNQALSVLSLSLVFMSVSVVLLTKAIFCKVLFCVIVCSVSWLFLLGCQ